MTTLFHDTETCAVCGQGHTIHGLTSTNTMGWCDLDTRPAEMKRSTMEYWFQECPACGYCAESTAESADGTAEIVRGEPYQMLRTRTDIAPTARRFLLQGLIAGSLADPVAGCWANIHAAWVFDDAKCGEQATACRLAAEAFAEQADAAGEAISRQTGVSQLIRADVLRRSGKPEAAQAMAAAGLATGCTENIRKILAYEISLIVAGDRACHDISGAFEP